MSTRCSKYYAKGIHLYWECNYEQLCIDWGDHIPFGHGSGEYGDFCMSKADWIEFATAILKACEEEHINPPKEPKNGGGDGR